MWDNMKMKNTNTNIANLCLNDLVFVFLMVTLSEIKDLPSQLQLVLLVLVQRHPF